MLSPNLLTRREWEVLKLVADTKSNREVAKELCISENTVEQHLRNIYRKLKVTNRRRASQVYIQFNLVNKNNGNPLLTST